MLYQLVSLACEYCIKNANINNRGDVVTSGIFFIDRTSCFESRIASLNWSEREMVIRYVLIFTRVETGTNNQLWGTMRWTSKWMMNAMWDEKLIGVTWNLLESCIKTHVTHAGPNTIPRIFF